MMSKQKRRLELYVHIPFCARKCLYCDFLSFRALDSVHEAYAEQLAKEIRAHGACCGEYRVTTVFIGGGTPSVINPELIKEIMKAVCESFDVARDAEITIEVNPGTLLKKKLPVYRAAGINRVSIGLQSADNGELRRLGRIHTYEDFLKSFQEARMAGFSNINVDLMSAIPGQTPDSWKATLKKVTMLKPEHLSAYSLIIEEGTPFWESYGDGGPGVPALPDEETDREMYHMTRSFLEELGYRRYEISNYARPGWECRHNIGYWTEEEYLGLGLGASSYVDGWRFNNERDLQSYLELDFDEEGCLNRLHQNMQQLTMQARMEEFMFLGLRMIDGVTESDFVRLFGMTIEAVYEPVIQKLIKERLLYKEGNRIALTEWGLDVSNYVMSEFLLN